jgi:Conserved in the green lineage and diatoms 27
MRTTGRQPVAIAALLLHLLSQTMRIGNFSVLGWHWSDRTLISARTNYFLAIRQIQSKRATPHSVNCFAETRLFASTDGRSSETDEYADASSFPSLRPKTSFGSEIVPVDQRPVNEFLDVTSQPLFGWAAESTAGLVTRLLVLFIVSFVVLCYPIAGATYTGEGYFWHKLVAATVGDLLFVLAMVARIYTGWSYLGSRLLAPTIEYEETGWYDGALERKTNTELARDRLLYADRVKPVVQRLQQVAAAVAILTAVSLGSLQYLNSQKPMLNQYDPSLLQELSSNDKLADYAASQSSSKPTYCDNRYYRAVAGGGQGCD